MKSYPTKAYYNYARKLLEGEAAAADSKLDADFKSVDNAQFKKLVASASVGAVGALACLKYLDRYFSISSLGDACTKLKEYALRVASTDTVTVAQKNALAMKGLPNNITHNRSIFARMGAAIASAIERALNWVRRMAGSITAKVPALRQPIVEGSSATYGSVLCMALAAAAVGAVIYKIYKVIKNRINSSVETAEAFVIKQTKRMKKALAESNAMFKELGALTLTEAPYVDKNVIRALPYGMKDVDALGKMNAASAAADPAGIVNSATGKVASGVGFIDSVKAHIMVMWNDTKNFVRYHPALCIVVGLCAALIACWYGTKKYMESKGVSMAESVRPAKKTRRVTRKPARSF